MKSYDMLLILSLSFALIFCIVTVLFSVWSARIMQKQIDRLTLQNQDLLNRIQSGDLRTYHSLSSKEITSEEYMVVSKSDESELQQLQDLNGLGEALYDDNAGPADDEFRETLGEFGIRL